MMLTRRKVAGIWAVAAGGSMLFAVTAKSSFFTGSAAIDIADLDCFLEANKAAAPAPIPRLRIVKL